LRKNFNGWKKAVNRSLGWNEDNENYIQNDENAENKKDAMKDKSTSFPSMALLLTSSFALVTGIIIGSRKR